MRQLEAARASNKAYDKAYDNKAYALRNSSAHDYKMSNKGSDDNAGRRRATAWRVST